jgi:hypothetical protein
MEFFDLKNSFTRIFTLKACPLFKSAARDEFKARTGHFSRSLFKVSLKLEALKGKHNIHQP